MEVVILGKTNCSSCVSAKRLCEQRSVEYEYQELGKDYNITQFYTVVPQSHKTFPAILVNDEFVGGLHQLQQILNGEYL